MEGGGLRVPGTLRQASSTNRRPSQLGTSAVGASTTGSRRLRSSSRVGASQRRRGPRVPLAGADAGGQAAGGVRVIVDGVNVTPAPLGGRQAGGIGSGVSGHDSHHSGIHRGSIAGGSMMGGSMKFGDGSDSVSDTGSQSLEWSSQMGSQMMDHSQLSESEGGSSPSGSDTGSFMRGARRRRTKTDQPGGGGVGPGGGDGAAALAEEDDEIVREEDLDLNVTIMLKETDTVWMLDMPDTCVGRDSSEAPSVTEANARYAALVKARIGNDSYVERGMQTFDFAPKNKDVQKNPILTEESGCQATVWDIYDTHEEEERILGEADARNLDQLNLGDEGPADGDAEADEEEPPADEVEAELGIEHGGDDTDSMSASRNYTGARRGNTYMESMTTGMNSFGPGMSRFNTGASSMAGGSGHGSQMGGGGGGGGAGGGSDLGGVRLGGDAHLEHLRGLPRTLRVVEHMITQNIFHGKHVEYRNFASEEAKELRRRRALQLAKGNPEPDEPYRPSPELEHLWSFTCEQAKGKNVSCLAFSQENMDLLAAGYGSFSFAKQSPGLVLCWSLKNPDFPDRVFRTPCGVTALDFSRASPYLLAVALYDGSIAIYDVRKARDRPILVSTHATGKHSEPAWCVRWVDRGPDRGEFLISMSTDGRVTQWSLRKGMEFTDLMRLKRVSAGRGEGKGEAFISRLASGMAFDFRDADIYLAGTEDGSIHKCSCSYNEQYLDTFTGHTGPVYQVVVSPYHPNVVLSASADWTVRLWDLESQDGDAKLVFEKGQSPIADVAWSPSDSTQFSTVTASGRLDLWDLTVSSIDPVASRECGSGLSRVAFARNAPVLVCGDDQGRVHVHKVAHAHPPSLNAEQMRVRLDEAITANSEGARAVKETVTKATL